MTPAKVLITGSGLYTPANAIDNDALVASYNAWVDAENARHREAIEAGERDALAHSSSEFIVKASGIHSRYVLDAEGILNPERMRPKLDERDNDSPGIQCEMALAASHEALAAAGVEAADIDLVIVACSNLERPYPAVAVELQRALGTGGYAFDMNVACSSATFGIQAAADMIRAGSAHRALVVNPEICSGHLEWRDRDCHFIFGDVATATIIEPADEAKDGYFKIRSTRCATEFSNNIRNNNGFLRRSRPDGVADRRDMQFMQNGRKVFKEVVPMVSQHIMSHLGEEHVEPDQLKRLWLHQANKSMNDFIGRKVLGREPAPGEQPNILQDYANTSSAGSIIAFAKNSKDFAEGDLGLICSFGAGYSVGSVLLERHG